MRIVHLLHEFPYPPNSGVRCDMWRRLLAFEELGHEVLALAWVSEGAGEMWTPEELAAVEAHTAGFVPIVIGADWWTKARRLWNLRRHPSYIASRIPPPTEREALIARVRDFAPDLIWLEGVHPSWLALELKRRLGLPLAYRSHNIEFRYVAEQAALARSARLRLALTAGTWGLEAAERGVHATAERTYDISADDLAWWRGQGFDRSDWLAPQPDPAVLATAGSPAAARDIDLLFVGSLVSPNNVAGLEWYADAVHPRVTAAIPDLSVTIAGRAPSPALAKRLGAAGLTLVADPADLGPLFARSRVMLNPILHGSGINIKTVDMLATGQRVVTTPKGARGLPAEVVAELDVADDAAAFAERTIDAVRAARGGRAGGDRAALIDRVFGVRAVARALAPFEGGRA